MIVDDARFSGAIISRTLKAAGFKDVRSSNSAEDALKMLESRPVNVLIADWLMPGMDGLALSAQVRQLDEANNHFTYIILLTAKEGDDALAKAFDEGVDDFINKSTMTQQLLPRIFAADRLSTLHNQLLKDNQLLIDSNQRLRKYSLVDPLTGLGNTRHLLERLDANIKHARTRGGAVGLIFLQFDNYAEIEAEHGKQVLRETVQGMARRLRQLVRPLDVVTRLSNQEFALVTLQQEIIHANSATFRRIYEALNVKALKTSQGYISIKAPVCMVVANEATGLPRPDQMLARAKSQINNARDTGRVMVIRW